MTETDRLQEWADVPRGLAEIVAIEANKHGFTVKQLRSSSLERQRFVARQSIVRIARDKGFSFPQIGRALNRDHSTIVSMVHGRRA
jgi:chromosomal replication initiation ATPase DnaA